MADKVLEVRDLQTVFDMQLGKIHAVDGVSFEVARGEVLGLVGESGSGKTVTGFSILRLIDKPGRIAGGQIRFHGRDLLSLSDREMRGLRGGRIAMIFQDPMMTLNPVLRIGTQMVEAILAHRSVSRAEARNQARDALGAVGIPSPAERLDAYPHQLSGGMRQRVAIAIAMLNEPDLIIADEPTTALDVTIQAQILYRMQKLCSQRNTALIWITHDLSVVAQLADRICVMYGGRVIEQGRVGDVLTAPRHPYTRGLIDSVPAYNAPGERLKQIPGSIGSIMNLPQGCGFAPRCTRAVEACSKVPPVTELEQGWSFRCFNPMPTAHDGNVKELALG